MTGYDHFSINNSAVEAKTLAENATTARALRYAISDTDNVIATASVNSDGSDAAEYVSENNETYKYFKTTPHPITKYNLWVGGVQVTSLNAEDVFKDGAVKFDPDANTLTLNNANLSGGYENSVIHDELSSALNIVLIGNNTINGENINNGIKGYAGCDINISSGGKLTIQDVGHGIQAQNLSVANATIDIIHPDYRGLFAGSDMVITDSTVRIEKDSNTTYYDCVNVQNGTLTVNNSDITITSAFSCVQLGNVYAGTTKFVLNSGTVTLNTTGTEPALKGLGNHYSIEINGGKLDITSVNGGTNITDITYGEGVEYQSGTSLADSGNVSVALTAAHVHSPVKVPANPATSSEAGNKEYYICDCGKWFWDAEGTQEISDRKSVVILPTSDAKLETETKTEQTIQKTDTDKKDVSGSEYKRLKLKATAKKQTITISWQKIKGAKGYIIYGAACGKKMKRIAAIKSAKTVKKTFKKLKKGTYYKYIVAAYKKTADGKNRVITKSTSAHCCTDGGKKGNPTGITIKKTKLTVKKGNTVTLKPAIKSKKKVSTHIAKIRYESSNAKIVKVDKNGKAKGVKKGSATIYMIAQNGLCKTVKITVK